MDVFLSISISGHRPLPGFVCLHSRFTVILALIGSIICDDLSPMAPWGSGYASSCCDGCCCSYNECLMPWVVDYFFVSPNSRESWRVDDIESTIDMEYICFIVDCNVEFVEDMGDVVG